MKDSGNLQESFYQWLPEQFLPGSDQAMGSMSARHLIVNEPETLMVYKQQFIEQKMPNILEKMT